jgi:hypothetical protein
MTKLLATATVLMLLCGCDKSSHPLVLSGSGSGGVLTQPVVGKDAGSGNVAQSVGLDGGASATATNTLVATVDPGPHNIGYTNGLFASITLCVPGTTTCQTIDHLLVDTGSVGVRVLESELTVALPVAKDTSGVALAECTPFVDGTAWGPLRTADVKLGEETASNLPIQLIGEGAYAMPSNCTGTPITNFETLAANGILGVGVYLQDCGDTCTQSARSKLNPGLYYACSSTKSSGCAITSVPLAQQVAHPVAAFPENNNGVIIQLPSIAATGAASVSGLLVFGIGTQSNNELGSATVLALDDYGWVNTTFPVGGTLYTSYIDSGSNGLFFLNAAKSNLKQCTGNLKDFYCPSSTANLNATLSSVSGASATIAFSVANASKLDSQAYALSDLAGPMPGYPTDTSVPGFDWGLPFFFGRNVYTAIETKSTPGGNGPFFAF